MTTTEYAAALLYCDRQIQRCDATGDHGTARRYAALESDLWGDIKARSPAFGLTVERRMDDMADSPDLCRDLAADLVEDAL